VNTQAKSGKKSVELQPAARPSRIRRQPVPAVEAQKALRDAWWESQEWEIRLALAGIVFFAVGIIAVILDIAHLLSQ
jgi:hypothetical protein